VVGLLWLGAVSSLPQLHVLEKRRYESVTQMNLYQVIDLLMNFLKPTNVQSSCDTKYTQRPTSTSNSVIFCNPFFVYLFNYLLELVAHHRSIGLGVNVALVDSTQSRSSI